MIPGSVIGGTMMRTEISFEYSYAYSKIWEIEEIACIYTFAMKKFDRVFDDIRWDVHQENPKFEGQFRPPTPEGAFDFDSSCQFYPSPFPS